MKKAFALFLCALAVFFLIATPSLIYNGLKRDVYYLREKQKEGRYTGSLTMWHVVSFKTGGETGSSYLAARIRDFEKINPYVFIDLTSLTAAEAEEKLKTGELPDLISFPLGFPIHPDELASLPALQNILPAYARSGGGKAYPYMADFYTLTVNEDAFFYRDYQLPSENTLTREQAGGLLTAAGEISFSTTPYISPASALDIPLPEKTSLLENFLAQESPVFLSPSAEAAKIDSSKMMLKSYYCTHYTDMVQLMGHTVREDGAKAEMCQEFCASLLTEKSQTALENLAMMPVVAVNDIYSGAPLYLEAYKLLSKNAAVPESLLNKKPA